MYNTYAGKVGFSIRKNQTKRRHDGSIYQKYIVCSNEGHRETVSSKDTTRTGCNARIQFSVSREGLWTVQKVVTDHNHYLASPNKVHKLRSQRHVIEADRHLIGQIREARMKPSQVEYFMVEFYGGPDKVPFSKMDCNNEIVRERKKYLESNDSQTLLEYLKNKQREDPTFFYAIQVDEKDGRIANFFWADAQISQIMMRPWQEQLHMCFEILDNEWMAKLYELREKWAAVYRDSFTADMNSTQRSEECEKVSHSLRENELDADFSSRRKNPVTYSSKLPLLKTASESYTRRMYSEFEEEFTGQF
uniref:FAR1 domain-containing protein n=1 Tax=Aegilops tauschii subsp. strangulata TaxID=200361 RepID=A0A452XFT7_AEGTS